MADMDENNEVEQQVNGGESEESPKEEESPSQENQKPEPTPEEKEMMALAEESPEESGSEEVSESPEETPESSEEQKEIPDEGEQPAEGGSDGLLSQSDIDNALKDAVGDGGGLTDPDVKQADFQQLSSASDEGEVKNIELLMDVELPISIELGKTKMNIADILGLAPGSIVELDKLVGEPVDLLVNQRCVARGEVVVVEENFGLRITQLVSPEERLRNLQ